jgi:tRNA-(ms[2]io[6]A)-hydroxylase
MKLKTATPSTWLDMVMSDFDAFLVDHAACERKASATGMSFVVRYPDRPLLIDPMIAFAREELAHFHQVYGVIAARGLRLAPDAKDAYVNALRGLTRSERDQHLLDRLLVAGIVEARGCERFALVTDSLPEGSLRELYAELTRAEARHHGLFVRLARLHFADQEVDERLEQLLAQEAEVVASLPFRAAVH